MNTPYKGELSSTAPRSVRRNHSIRFQSLSVYHNSRLAPFTVFPICGDVLPESNIGAKLLCILEQDLVDCSSASVVGVTSVETLRERLNIDYFAAVIMHG